jgi:hypothetical protein
MGDIPIYNPWAPPIFPNNAAFGTGSPAEDAQRQPNMLDNFVSHIAGALGRGFMAPGNALASTTPITSDQMIAPAMDMAGMIMGGGVGGAPSAVGETLLGSGPVRALPRDNYLSPVSKYTDKLYREMSPGEALADLPTSVAHGGYGAMGVPRKFYADHPDLALGQGSNKGVRVEYDAAPFEGTINKSKPAWDLQFQNGMAEYLAAPKVGANIRDAVRRIEADPTTMSRVEIAQYQRLLTNLENLGWNVDRGGGKIVATAPGNKR